MALTNGQTRETLASDMWQACKILRRDNNCGGVMEYIEHLAWLLFLLSSRAHAYPQPGNAPR